MNRIAAALLALLLITGCTPYRVTHNLPYGPGANQIFDCYEPLVNLDGNPRPALLVVHGGGYIGGDKDWADSVADKYCPFGYVIMAINYTLADGTAGNAWPHQLDDAKAALAYLQGPSAGWMKIRQPIAGLGVSAGAHLVAALHLQGDLPFAVCVSGPYDFVNVPMHPLDDVLRALLGISPGDPIPPQARADISPVSWVVPGADVLMIHATYDLITPYEHATRFEAALQGVGAKSELITVDSDSHGSVWSDAVWATRDWLRARQ